MIQNFDQLTALTQKVREVVGSGNKVAVVGWIDSNHSDFTRLVSSGAILFFEHGPTTLPPSVRYAVFTRFTKHSTSFRLKGQIDTHPFVLGTGQIRQVLESCRDVLLACQSKEASGVAEKGVSVSGSDEMHVSDGLLDFLTQPQTKKEEVKKMTEYDIFKQRFLAAASSNNGLVGCRMVNDLIIKSGVKEKIKQLVSLGWVEPFIAEKKTKVGWYKAGKLMLLETKPDTPPPPESPAARIEYLIAQKPQLIAQKEAFEKQVAEISGKLAMIEEAEAMLSKIGTALL